ncbi:MAG TPA: class I SAM-dependent methyltransferase [Chlamydiales bacterium]|nr:class I SAM-dependent methyltransferase [Chlamydiales bacterium]
MQRSFHLKLAKWYWEKQLRQGDVAIDATAGNGHDTLFLAQLGLSSLFSLDIQHSAIQKTEALLKENLTEQEFEKVTLCQRSHDDLKKISLSKAPNLIVYNLGYLPGGDKNIHTRVESTLSSVQSALSILDGKGALSITCYPGHEEGMKEERELLRFKAALSTEKWETIHHFRPNRPQSPSLLWICKR